MRNLILLLMCSILFSFSSHGKEEIAIENITDYLREQNFRHEGYNGEKIYKLHFVKNYRDRVDLILQLSEKDCSSGYYGRANFCERVILKMPKDKFSREHKEVYFQSKDGGIYCGNVMDNLLNSNEQCKLQIKEKHTCEKWVKFPGHPDQCPPKYFKSFYQLIITYP